MAAELVDVEPANSARIRALEADARAIRRRIAAPAIERARLPVDALGVHLYPRSFDYEVDGSLAATGTAVLMYGSDALGRTVRARVTGFRPYACVRTHGADPETVHRFVQQLNAVLIVLSVQRRNGPIRFEARNVVRARRAQPIVEYENVEAVPVKASGEGAGFRDGRRERFIRIYFYAPAYVRVARDVLEYVYAADRASPAISPGGLGALDDVTLVGILAGALARRDARAAAGSAEAEPATKRARKPTEERMEAAAAGSVSLDAFFAQADAAAAAASRAPAASSPSSSRKRRRGADTGNVAEVDDAEAAAEADLVNPWGDVNLDILFDDDDDDDTRDQSAAAAAADDAHAPVTTGFVVAGALRHVRATCATMAASLGRSLRLEAARPVEVYEADIDFVLRYLIDAGFKPEECVRLRPGSRAQVLYRAEGARELNDVTLPDVHWCDLVRCTDDAFQDAVPPQIVASFDIETETGPAGAFPKAESERVFTICVTMLDPVVDGTGAHAVRRAFQLGAVALPSAAEQLERQRFVVEREDLYCFACEEELLLAFGRFMRALQPDVLTGFYIDGFDVPYLIDRASARGIGSQFASLARSDAGALRSIERTFSSRAHGTHVYRESSADGLCVLDLWQTLKRSTSFKLRSYSLESVAQKFLGESKADVPYSAINGLQATPDGRHRLVYYCFKDTDLPARILGKLQTLVELIERARLVGTPLDMLMRRGMQVQGKAFVYRKCLRHVDGSRYLIYTRTSAEVAAAASASYGGGFVAEPLRGLHDRVVATLDFNSLYPSIMRTFGTCITTLVRAADRVARSVEFSLADEDCVRAVDDALPDTPAEEQPFFVRSARFTGLLPGIVAELLAERKRVKAVRDGYADTDAFMYALYDKRQLAIKLTANSLYGITGAPTSFFYCPEIAATVTALGRSIIQETGDLVGREFTIANGYTFNANLVYGDTDSVFVRFDVPAGAVHVKTGAPLPPIDIPESARLGAIMAAFVTEHFQRKYGVRADNVLRIVFEKAFSRIIFYQKKRYVGWKWELNSHGVMVRKERPSASGMETERRDSSLLVARVVEHVVGLLLDETTSSAQALDRVQVYLAHDIVAPLESGTLAWNEAIESRQYRKLAAEYREGGRTPPMHIRLAERLVERFAATGEGKTYTSGDRIEFIVREPAYPGEPANECAEDPEYAWQHGHTLSMRHYLYGGVYRTMARILEPVLDGTLASSTLDDFFGSSDEEEEEEEEEADVPSASSSSSSSSSPQTTTRTAAEQKRAEKRVIKFVSEAPRKRKRSAHAVLDVGAYDDADDGTRMRCVLCGVPSASAVCPSTAHSAAERAALVAGDAAARTKVAATRDGLARICRACDAGWQAKDAPERAAALPGAEAERDIEATVPCSTPSCTLAYWQRRTADREWRALGGHEHP